MGQSIIEINGTKYDASTGLEVVSSTPPKTIRTSNGSNVDGIVSNNTSHPVQTAITPKTAVTIQPRLKVSAKRQINDISIAHTKRVKRSQTLMRSVVKKPKTIPHSAPIQQAPTKHPLVHSASYTTAQNSDVRIKNAVHTTTHSQVKRFSNQPTNMDMVKPIMVNSMPVKHPQQTAHQPKQAVATTPHQPMPVSSPASRFVDSQLAKAVDSEPQSPFKKKPLHKRIHHSVKNHKIKSLATASLAALLIAGFIAYQNLPTITLAIANREAGISAKIPKGVPSNFALSPNISKSRGQIVLSYSSRVDDRKFFLTQLKTDTTNASLKQKVAEESNNQFQTYEAGGITIYLSGNNRADWIDGGMRYNITGDTGLSPDQLAIIASSL